jgi:hypothetical protein
MSTIFFFFAILLQLVCHDFMSSTPATTVVQPAVVESICTVLDLSAQLSTAHNFALLSLWCQCLSLFMVDSKLFTIPVDEKFVEARGS